MEASEASSGEFDSSFRYPIAFLHQERLYLDVHGLPLESAVGLLFIWLSPLVNELSQ
jgi:hypothetical protein